MNRIFHFLILATCSTLSAQTAVSIVGEDFYINTYQGRTWKGPRIEGLLMNSRMVQATYDDPRRAQLQVYAHPFQ